MKKALFYIVTVFFLTLISCKKIPEIQQHGMIDTTVFVTIEEIATMDLDSAREKYVGKLVSFKNLEAKGIRGRWEGHPKNNACPF